MGVGLIFHELTPELQPIYSCLARNYNRIIKCIYSRHSGSVYTIATYSKSIRAQPDTTQHNDRLAVWLDRVCAFDAFIVKSVCRDVAATMLKHDVGRLKGTSASGTGPTGPAATTRTTATPAPTPEGTSSASATGRTPDSSIGYRGRLSFARGQAGSMPVSATEPTATTSTPSSVPSSSAASTGLVSATGLTATTAAGSISSTSSSTSSAVSVGSAASTAAPAATPSSAALARTPLTRTLQPGLAYWQWRLIQYQEHPDFEELCWKHLQFELAVGAWYSLDNECDILIRFISRWDARYRHHGALHAWRKGLSYCGAVRFASFTQVYSHDLGNYLYAVALRVFAASCGPSDPLRVAITRQNDCTNGDCLEAVMGWYYLLSMALQSLKRAQRCPASKRVRFGDASAQWNWH